MSTITKDLGMVTAYAYAVSQGYTGTEEEFAELMASYATTAESAKESAETAEAFAKGTVEGTPVESGETGYQDNSKYYKEQAASSATSASGSASGASTNALIAEGNAVGQQNGTDVASGSPYYENNAKYYAEQSASSEQTATQKATAASGSADIATAKALVAEGYAEGKQNGQDVASGSPYYHANAKYYKDEASTSATNANTDALKAEGYAVGKQGGEDVPSGSPYYENNAKYYAEQAEAAAEQAEETLNTYARVDGYYQDMTVGNAEQLVATVFEEDQTPYLFRTSGGSIDIGDRETDMIVGGSIVWNQMIPIPDSDISKTENGVTFTDNRDGSFTVQTDVNGATAQTSLKIMSITYLQDHVYYNHGCPSTGDANSYFIYDGGVSETGSGKIIKKNAGTKNYQIIVKSGTIITTPVTFKPQLFDLTQMFGTTIADYIYALETANAGAGVAFFKKLFPKPFYAYDEGTLMHVSGLVSHDLIGFNAFDPETGKAKLVGGQEYQITGTYTALSLDGETVTPDASGYFTPDASGELTVTGGGADTCVHLVWDGERDGEYEEYELHSYALDDSLTLRGIPKLDSANNLYYDGDEYASDGTVTRRYGIVDLGSLTWSHTSPTRSAATLNTMKLPVSTSSLANIITQNGYTQIPAAGTLSENQFAILQLSGEARLFFYYDGITEPSGLMVYELKTPTTETAEPYTNPQIVDDFGTEEYVTNSIVPVGHITKYQPNLRAKLEMAPDSPDANGDYVVRHNNGENTYVLAEKELPALPSEDGTYHLKVTVSGSTKTLSWEAE